MIIRNIVAQMIASRFSVVMMQNFEGMAGFFQRHFAGTDNLRVVSIILLLLAFTLFLFLVIILYIKSLLNFIKTEGSNAANAVNVVQPSNVAEELSEERTKESALAKEIEKSQQRAEWQRRQELLKNAQQRRLSAEEELKKNSRRKNEIDISKAEKISGVPDRSVDYRTRSALPGADLSASRSFDWSGSKTGELDEISAGIIPFKPRQIDRPLGSMSGIIMNMLARNIEIAKIAQTVKYYCKDSASEEDVIQQIDAIRNFIGLCNTHKFSSLPDAAELPTPEEALYDLAQNDPTYCLQLLQSLMNATIDRAEGATLSQRRDLSFLEAATYACMFGTLAAPDNPQMATEAYEMAVELSERNVNAWSRVADMYDVNQTSKAIWAYQHLLKIADETQHLHQISNAQKHLAQYYYDQGDTRQGAKLYDISRQYYDSLGINQPLTPRETEIIKIIESKQQEDLPDTVQKLLQISIQQQKRSFV